MTLPSRPHHAQHYPGLEWLRAVAAVLVVVLHAGMPYLTHPLPGLIWATRSQEPSATVNAVCWTINSCIMPIFFLMTGFLAAGLYHRLGARGFLQHRWRRIGGPLLFGMVFILPLDLYAWLLGWVDQDLIPISRLRSLKVRGELGSSLWGLSHLWYLEYVLFYSLAATGIVKLLRSGSAEELPVLPLRRTRRNWLPAALLCLGGILAGAALACDPRVVIGFRTTWGPRPAHLLYYVVPFVIGWNWNRLQPHLSRFTPVAGVLLSGCGWFLMYPSLLQHLEQESQGGHPLVPWGFGLHAVAMSVSLFGWAVQARTLSVPAGVGYLSRASFWIYLAHHPLVALLQVDLSRSRWPGMMQTIFITGVALALCLATYEVLVRRTWVGALLNGRRDPALSSERNPDREVTVRQAA